MFEQIKNIIDELTRENFSGEEVINMTTGEYFLRAFFIIIKRMSVKI
jgi:hypothetical protein